MYSEDLVQASQAVERAACYEQLPSLIGVEKLTWD